MANKKKTDLPKGPKPKKPKVTKNPGSKKGNKPRKKSGR